MGASPQLGRVLDHYRLLEKLGEGGMGVVWLAEDTRLRRKVALKFLRPYASLDPIRRTRFEQEARAAAALSHPGIATVHELADIDGQLFIVFEYVPGCTLRSSVKSGGLPPKELLEIGCDVADALAAAHAASVVHRDLKPENVMRTPVGTCKVLDFGLAHIGSAPVTDCVTETESVSQLTTPGAIIGTLRYMAPEQLEAKEVDFRTDIFSFGVLVYELAIGVHPFASGSSCSTIGAILKDEPAPLTERNPMHSKHLEQVVSKCLRKDRNDRYQSTRELASALVSLRKETVGSHIYGIGSTSGATVIPIKHTVSAPGKIETVRTLSRRKLILLGLVAIALIAGSALWLTPHRRVADGVRIAPSIAVLPFVNMSPEKEQEYFSDGLTEELRNDLAKMPGLHVAGRTSSFQFKGKTEDLRLIGAKLNVANVLEGSIRKQGNRVRITAQLIKTTDGFQLWAEMYDREVTDVFAVQDEIARSVAASLNVTLLGDRTVVLSPTPGKNVEAYDAYLQGRYLYQHANEQSLEKAAGYFEQAIQLEPGYASAWARLALVRRAQVDSGYVPAEVGWQQARQAAERALVLDQNLAEAHLAVGIIKTFHDWDWAGADASFRKALALEPTNVTAIVSAADLAAAQGHFDDALSLYHRAVELDPLVTGIYVHLAFADYYAGRLEEGVEAAKKSLELNPQRPVTHYILGRVYLAQMRPQDARSQMEQESERGLRLCGLALADYALGLPRESKAALDELIAKAAVTNAFQIAEIYAFRGENDQALAWLQRAYAQRDPGLSQLKGDPLFTSIEKDPRYIRLLKQMRLAL